MWLSVQQKKSERLLSPPSYNGQDLWRKSIKAAPLSKVIRFRLKKMPNQRQQLTQAELKSACAEVLKKLAFRVRQKGKGVMASNHEILGIISQETSEYEQAIHQRLSDEEKVQELIDIAVAALFGIASIRSKGTDW